MVANAEEESTINYEPSKIQEFYEGARIFITGGSGFLGNLLVQKLIRDCPGLSKIYLLIRAKKGKTSEQRLEEMFEDIVFEKMKQEQPKYIEKIKLVVGDIEQVNLGLNEADKKLLSDEVNIVFHVAATVRFDEKIKKATQINIGATRDLLELAKTMTHLKAFLHISTAFSHCYRSEIDEQIYDVPMKYDRLSKITEALNEDELDILTPKLFNGWPNTYAFSKAVAENVIKEYGKDLPVAILRPSMVLVTYKDPIESWINNFYGPVGISIAFGLGLLRAQYVIPDGVCDIVPGDFVVNAMIAVAAQIGKTFSQKELHNNELADKLSAVEEVPVFNYTSGGENPITWRKFVKLGSESAFNYQSMHSVWYFLCILTPNYYLSRLYNIFLHLIPAYIVDIVLFVLGKKCRMVKVYEKMQKFQKVLHHFAVNEWKFKNDNTQELWKNLNNTDRKLFPFSMKELDWNDYFIYYSKGIRVHLVKDPLETLPAALARYQKLKILHYFLVSVFCFTGFSAILRVFQMFLR